MPTIPMRKLNRAMLATIAGTLVAIAMPSQARDMAAGTTEVGGSSQLGVNANIVKVNGLESTKTRTTAFQINARHYLKDDIALGLNFSRNNSVIEGDDGSLSNTTYTIAPGLAINTSLNEQVSLIMHAGLSINGLRQAFDGDAISLSGKGVLVGLELQSFVSESAALTVGASLNRYRLENEELGLSSRLTDRNFNLGVSLFF